MVRYILLYCVGFDLYTIFFPIHHRLRFFLRRTTPKPLFTVMRSRLRTVMVKGATSSLPLTGTRAVLAMTMSWWLLRTKDQGLLKFRHSLQLQIMICIAWSATISSLPTLAATTTPARTDLTPWTQIPTLQISNPFKIMLTLCLTRTTPVDTS
jgi:hypothetical protein